MVSLCVNRLHNCVWEIFFQESETEMKKPGRLWLAGESQPRLLEISLFQIQPMFFTEFG